MSEKFYYSVTPFPGADSAGGSVSNIRGITLPEGVIVSVSGSADESRFLSKEAIQSVRAMFESADEIRERAISQRKARLETEGQVE